MCVLGVSAEFREEERVGVFVRYLSRLFSARLNGQVILDIC